jgi:hypothetical protein
MCLCIKFGHYVYSSIREDSSSEDETSLEEGEEVEKAPPTLSSSAEVSAQEW